MIPRSVHLHFQAFFQDHADFFVIPVPMRDRRTGLPEQIKTQIGGVLRALSFSFAIISTKTSARRFRSKQKSKKAPFCGACEIIPPSESKSCRRGCGAFLSS